MRTVGLPAACLAAVCVVFLAFVGSTASLLPERVASHFAASGVPDGWMTRGGYLTVTSLMGLGLPAFLAGLCYATRFFPDWMINLPNKGYWLAPERRRDTNNYLFGHCLWMVCLVVLHFWAMHSLTIFANRRSPALMSGTAAIAATGVFLALLGVWIIALVRHFRRAGL